MKCCSKFLLVGFIILSLFSGINSARADRIDDLGLVCVARLHFLDEGRVERATMVRASYDPLYLTADIGDFGFGAYTVYLDEGGVGLIIYNHPRNDFSSGVVGFRHVSGTKIFVTNLSHREHSEEGLIEAQVNCSYDCSKAPACSLK